MLRIDTSNPAARVAESVRRQVAFRENGPRDPEALREDIRVSLTDLGKASKPRSNDDIDESDLPDGIKELLKMIRELKAQIAERQAELEAIAADQGLDEEARLQRLEEVRTQLDSLRSALSSANLNLARMMRESNLSEEQSIEVGRLLMA